MPFLHSGDESAHSGRFLRRILFFSFGLVLIIGTAILLHIYLKPSGRHNVTIYVPVGLIAIFISFYIFGEFNRLRQAKAQERREMLHDRRDELLNKAVKKKAPGKDPERNN